MEVAGTQNSNITIEANDIQQSSKNGISIGQNSSTTVIVNNVIANNAQNGIGFATGVLGVQYLVNNTIVNNGHSGIESVSPQKLYIVNNIIIYTAAAGTLGERCVVQQGSGASSITQLNNLIVTHQSGVLQSDYRLEPTSTAKDKGTTNFAPLPVKDKDGNPRIHGGSIDLGAYECQN